MHRSNRYAKRRCCRLLAGLLVATCGCLKGSSSSMGVEVIPQARSQTKVTGRADVTDRSQQAVFYPDVYLSHIYFLASDELGGRGVGTPEIDRAAQYIADQFADAGVEPAGENGTYFHRVDVKMGLQVTAKTNLTIAGSPELEVDADYRPFAWSNDEDFEGQLAFVGYGLVNQDQDYDDYAGIDVTGKVVLMLRREPPSFNVDGQFSELAHFENKIVEADEHGAAAVLIVNRKPDSGKEDRLFPLMGRGEDYGLPAFHITRALADKLLDQARMDTLDEMQEKLDAETAESCSGLFANIGVKGRAGLGKMVTRSKNVVGLVRGQGPNADEFVVLGAHYDHLGTSKPHSWLGKLYESESRIHNGADDNASGTAGLIELGKALSRWPGLNRSVLLIAFTGEELGLHGSRQFVERPTVPLDKMVAMLNMDMIGRMSPGTDSLTIYGTRTAEQFGEMIDYCAGEVGLKVTTHPNGSGRSDAASFYRADIPAMHFFTGLHQDYHRPTDDAEKVNQADATRVVQMIYRMTRQLVDKEQRPTYRYIAGRARLSGQARRAVMGIWPDQSDDGAGQGVLVGRTSPNGPAEKAGLQTGDRILRLDGQEVSDLDSVLNVTGKKKPGDVLEVVIDRQGKQIELQLTLAAG